MSFEGFLLSNECADRVIKLNHLYSRARRIEDCVKNELVLDRTVVRAGLSTYLSDQETLKEASSGRLLPGLASLESMGALEGLHDFDLGEPKLLLLCLNH